jgi:spermidine/putrescine transport system permease protein
VPLFWLALFFIVPMAIVWLYSFGENAGPADIAISGTLDNYKRATEWLYISIFLKSFAVAALVTLICLIIGFPVAMAITFASPKWRPWLLLGIMLPFWTNLLIRTYALMMLMGTNGYANMGLGALWEGVSWLRVVVGMQPLEAWTPVQLLYNNFAVVLGLVYVHLPFMVLPLYAALDRLDKSLIEASLDLGAGHLRTLMKIVVPLAGPGILAGVMITLIPALGAYLTPDLMGGTESQMIANVIERQFKRANDWPFGAALSFLLIYAMFILIALQSMRREKSGEAR